MAPERDIVAELSHRIQADIDHFGGTMPERSAVAWRGYLAAMLEWNLIPVAHYDQLLAKIPEIMDDPAIAILRGRD
ncbi:MAG TPA: hypothetical protein VFT22_19320 [Kofleriaceae bacterium]|nr:hypothetical protein [Kofleriaceae bacterium]